MYIIVTDQSIKNIVIFLQIIFYIINLPYIMIYFYWPKWWRIFI